MDIGQSLKNTENDLRDLIFSLLYNRFGKDWISNCGVASDRIEKWQQKQIEDQKRLTIEDTRILYYSDFYDLKTIVKKNWDQSFKDVFENLKEFETLFSILEEYRNPEAHRRELLPYQKNLAIGISGKIRSQITSYYSKIETGESYYPRIEYAQDSFGNSYSLNIEDRFRSIQTKTILRPGNVVEFTIAAFDPMGGKILYAINQRRGINNIAWTEDNNFTYEITDADVQKSSWIFIAIKGERKYHASHQELFGEIDDEVRFGYEVLPPR